MAPVLFIHGNKILEERWGHAGSTFNKFTKGGSGPAAAVAPAAAIRRWCESAPPLYIYGGGVSWHCTTPTLSLCYMLYIYLFNLPPLDHKSRRTPNTSRDQSRSSVPTPDVGVPTLCQHCANTSFGVPTPGCANTCFSVPTLASITKKVCQR